MNHVTSRDGTCIAYEITGNGPALVLVGGAFCDRHARASGTPLAALLAQQFTVVSYDRRGRGDSTDTAPWSVEREVEDLAALVTAVGGRASLYGISSGGLLALEAARREVLVDAIAVYEAPVVLDAARRPSEALAVELAALTASDQRSEAVGLFLNRVVGVPTPVIDGMRRAPMWRGLEAIAHTLSYDVRLADGAVRLLEHLGAVGPVTVLGGAKSPPFMREGAEALTKALRDARLVSLADQTHDVDPVVLAKAICEHLGR